MAGPAHTMPDDSFGTSAANAVTVLAGVWLVVSPFVLTHADGRGRWNDITVGVVICLLALIRAIAQRDVPWLGLVGVALGGWLVIAPWVLGYDGLAATVNDMVVGAVVAVAVATGAVLAFHRRARGGDDARRVGHRSAAEVE